MYGGHYRVACMLKRTLTLNIWTNGPGTVRNRDLSTLTLITLGIIASVD